MSHEEVINFWFGGDLDNNYKTKWFPTASKQLQQTADEIITRKFSNLLKDAIEHKLDDWTTSTKSTIALIVTLDQFSRHIYRNLPSEAIERKQADELALQIAEKLTENENWDEGMNVDEFVFSLMPFRHSATLERLQYVLQHIDKKSEQQEKYSELLQKFRKQTLRRLQHLQDRRSAEEAADIFEYHEFQADETNILNEPLVHSTKLFLEKYVKKQLKNSSNTQPVVAISLSGGVDSMVIAKILSLLRPHFNFKELFSLHIDYGNREESKDEAAFVHDWATRHGFTHFERTINEVKRGVTDRSEYEKITRNIRYGFYKEILKSHMGWIEESNHSHGISHNDDGNNQNEENQQNDGLQDYHDREKGLECGLGIIFGHHAGDVQENVLSNIMRGCSPLSLAGMHEAGMTEGVPVWRPLLKHIKDEIFAFAHKYGIPYFRDTTPTWSTRGKLRRQLVPLLIDMYGTGCLRNISSLAAQSDEAMGLVAQNIYDPFMNTVQRYSCGLVFNVIQYRHQPLCFWKEMLKNLMHSMSMNMIREKAVLNFLKRIQLVTQNQITGELTMSVPGWLELRKGFYTYLTPNGDLIIYRDGVIAPAIDERDEENKVEKLSESTTFELNYNGQIGNWKISCTEVQSIERLTEEVKESIDETIPQEVDCDDEINFQNILNGTFCYLLQFDSNVHRLKFVHSKTKPTNCAPLFNLDTKIRLGMPFLGPDISEKDKKGKKKNQNLVSEVSSISGEIGVVGEEGIKNESDKILRKVIIKYVYSPLK